jgi:hypothetical protein
MLHYDYRYADLDSFTFQMKGLVVDGLAIEPITIVFTKKSAWVWEIVPSGM